MFNIIKINNKRERIDFIEAPLPPDQRPFNTGTPTDKFVGGGGKFQKLGTDKPQGQISSTPNQVIQDLLTTYINTPEGKAYLGSQHSSEKTSLSDDKTTAAAHTRAPIILSGEPTEQQEKFSQYFNFHEQFAQAQLLLEQNPTESACLFLIHQEQDPRDVKAMVDVVIFHQMRRNQDSTYTLQQIPAVHKLGWASREDYALNLATFSNIFREGFYGITDPKKGHFNSILYAEGEREYFIWTKLGNPEDEGEDYFVELWSSYPFFNSLAQEMELDRPSPQLLINEKQANHTIYSRIGFAPPSDIRGVIVFPEHLNSWFAHFWTQFSHLWCSSGEDSSILERDKNKCFTKKCSYSLKALKAFYVKTVVPL